MLGNHIDYLATLTINQAGKTQNINEKSNLFTRLDATVSAALFATNASFTYLLSWVVLHHKFMGVRLVQRIIRLNQTTPRYCKRLPSHIGQEQACSRITWLVGCSVVRHHAENG